MLPSFIRYRGRWVGPEDLVFIRQLIAQHPDLSRRRLSAKLCAAWHWAQPNGAPRDMVCRGLMLRLHRAGLIELPAQRKRVLNNVVAHRRRRADVSVDPSPLECALAELGPLDIVPVRRTQGEDLFAQLLAQHHYLGYSRPVGEHLKYLVWARGRPIGCLAWSSAPRHLAARDRFIGWSPEVRRRNLHKIAYNTRFLILPWVNVPHLASHVLGRMARLLCADWPEFYHHPVHLLETFIDPDRFGATCYRAANWTRLGLTTGRGHQDQTKRANRSLKELWVHPLTRDFRRRLCHD